jgi:hypothetical protein
VVRPADLVGNPEVAAFMGELVDRGVREALDATLGPGRPVKVASPAELAARALPNLERVHEIDLDDVDLRKRVASRLGPDLVDHPAVLAAMDDAMHVDRGAHAVARDVFARDLEAAYAAPQAVRRERVQEMLAGERERIRVRHQVRPRRVEAILKASVRLPDEAYE